MSSDNDNIPNPPDTSHTTKTSPASSDEKAEPIEPGMDVEARHGDLGEEDVTPAKVRDVERDEAGDVTGIVVQKGVIFRKKLEVPPDRIAAVEPEGKAGGLDRGKVILNTTKQEIRDLSPQGKEALASEPPAQHDAKHGKAVAPAGADAAATPRFSLRMIGPGLLGGLAGNDSSAVTSYSVNGATNGYTQLWLMLLATPLYQAVQYACAKIGRVTQKGLAEILREHYGRRVAVPTSIILLVANIALIAADLVAIGTGLQLLSGITWEWFVVPVAAALWYLAVYKNFGVIKKIFMGMGFVFVAYLVTSVLSGAKWGLVLQATFVPHMQMGLAGISTAVALLGATVSPYTMYWQVQGEKEQKRPGTRKQKLKLAAIDILAGTVSGNLVAFAIILSTANTLFAHHKTVHSAADAAAALAPLLGPYAEILFAIGFIGAGLIAIPVLMASCSYGLSGLFGWSGSLWKKPWQSEGFYLIMTGALVVSLVVALLRFDPIQLMFWANVLQGILSPVLVVFVFLIGNNRRIMRSDRLGAFTNAGLVTVAAVMSVATILLFYSLLTGQGR
ncbi:MAG TPA: divalent metal cation transporter [Ktedonobacterales bacterium]|nr:divalent metal cation transporter [Ktedonobacterales bacterium]